MDEQRGRGADARTGEPPASALWPHLLDAVAAGGYRLTLEAPGGGRAVLVSEAELQRLESAVRTAPTSPLTAREREVLGLVARGLNGVQVAEHLGVSTNTVAQHLLAARRKYGVRSSSAAVQAACAAGHLDEGCPPGC